MLKADLKISLSDRLGDSDMIYWTSSNLDLIIKEALLTFGAISEFWKEDGFLTIPLQTTKNIYDLTKDLTQNQSSFSMDYTYGDLLDWLNMDLSENLSELSPTSEIFNLADIISLITKTINDFQRETELIVKSKTLPASASQSLIFLGNDVINIKGVIFSYLNENNETIKIILLRDDEFNLENLYPNYTQTLLTYPKFYSDVLLSDNSINIYPPPTITGELEVFYVSAIDESNTINLDTKINLPNNLVPYIRYGVLTQLFSGDGIAKDIVRGIYCTSRWKEGIVIGKNYNSILTAKLNNKDLLLDSVENLDGFSNWRNTDRLINSLGFYGYNLFLLNSKTILAETTLELKLNKNAPIPPLEISEIELKSEYLNTFVNYCIHLAFLKDGYEGLKKTNDYKDEFIKLGIRHNRRLLSRGVSYDVLMKQSLNQKMQKKSEIVDEASATV